MIARKAQKLIYNILILCFLTGGIIMFVPDSSIWEISNIPTMHR